MLRYRGNDGPMLNFDLKLKIKIIFIKPNSKCQKYYKIWVKKILKLTKKNNIKIKIDLPSK